MRYIGQHITTIIDQYRGDLPLAHFLKNYFRQFPILGSRDRKLLSAMAYSWYRCRKGFGNTDHTTEELVTACMKMCGNEQLLPPTMTGAGTPVLPFDINALFPYDIALSQGIEKESWLTSMLVQPHLFIRIRKDCHPIPMWCRMHRHNKQAPSSAPEKMNYGTIAARVQAANHCCLKI